MSYNEQRRRLHLYIYILLFNGQENEKGSIGNGVDSMSKSSSFISFPIPINLSPIRPTSMFARNDTFSTFMCL